ncbi:hypothetical protein RugamoR64_26640 [Duganella rhizosphaerae]|uniref:PEP-CTERM sorting domain-containing protein n=1 Tax=Duganella rhizosphaerae TaxID=2885763 RepID=UPI0030E91B5A
MKSLSRVVASLSLMLAASCASAYESHLDTNALTYDSSAPYATLEYDNPGATQITTGFGGYNTADTGAVFFAGGRTGSSLYQQDIQIAAKAGYTVTGYSLSTFFQSEVVNNYPVIIPDPSLHVNTAGVASADFTLTMTAKSIDGSTIYDRSSLEQSNLNGESGNWVTLNSPVMSLQNPFLLHLDQNLMVTAIAGLRERWISGEGYDYVDDQFFAAHAFGIAVLLELTVYTAPLAAPVPEPEQYAMLLLGCALVGAVALRNKRRRS